MEKQFDIGEALAQPIRATTSTGFLLRLVLWGTLLSMLIYGFLGKSLVTDFITIMEYSEANGDSEFPPQFASFFLKILGLSILVWGVFILIEAAYHKNLLFGTDHGFFPFRLGNAELMVLLSHLVMLGILLLASIIMIPLILLTFGLGILLIIPAMIFVMVRLSTMTPLAVREGRLQVGQAWKISKPNFWMMLVTFIVIAVASYIVMTIVQYAMMFAVMGNFMALDGLDGASDEEAMAEIGRLFLEPGVFVPLIIGGFFYLFANILTYIWYYGVGNLVVRMETDNEEVFS